MVFINYSTSFGMILGAMTTNITGSVFLTLLIITLLIMAFFMVFRLPIEASIIFIMPFLLTVMAFESQFLAVTGVGLIYLAIIFVKQIFNSS